MNYCVNLHMNMAQVTAISFQNSGQKCLNAFKRRKKYLHRQTSFKQYQEITHNKNSVT